MVSGEKLALVRGIASYCALGRRPGARQLFWNAPGRSSWKDAERSTYECKSRLRFKIAFVVEGLPDFTAPPNTPDPRALLGCRRMQKVRNTKRPGRQAPGNAPDPPN